HVLGRDAHREPLAQREPVENEVEGDAWGGGRYGLLPAVGGTTAQQRERAGDFLHTLDCQLAVALVLLPADALDFLRRRLTTKQLPQHARVVRAEHPVKKLARHLEAERFPGNLLPGLIVQVTRVDQ